MGLEVKKVADEILAILESEKDVWVEYGTQEKAFLTETALYIAQEQFALISAVKDEDKQIHRENLDELRQQLVSEKRYVGKRVSDRGKQVLPAIFNTVIKMVLAGASFF